MTTLETKLINSYTVLVMAEEIVLKDVPETILSNGNTLRYEVELEEARRTTNIVPEPIDYNIPNRVEELEAIINTQEAVIEELEGTIITQDAVIEEILFDIIPTMLGGVGGE